MHDRHNDVLAWDSRLSLDFFDSGLYTCAAVARLTLALAKLSCYNFLHNDVTMSSLVSTGNCKLGHDCRWVRSHRRHYATRLRCWHIYSDLSRLSPTTVANCVGYTPLTPTRLHSTVESRRRHSASSVCIGLYYFNGRRPSVAAQSMCPPRVECHLRMRSAQPQVVAAHHRHHHRVAVMVAATVAISFTFAGSVSDD